MCVCLYVCVCIFVSVCVCVCVCVFVFPLPYFWLGNVLPLLVCFCVVYISCYFSSQLTICLSYFPPSPTITPLTLLISSRVVPQPRLFSADYFHPADNIWVPILFILPFYPRPAPHLSSAPLPVPSRPVPLPGKGRGRGGGSLWGLICVFLPPPAYLHSAAVLRFMARCSSLLCPV